MIKLVKETPIIFPSFIRKIFQIFTLYLKIFTMHLTCMKHLFHWETARFFFPWKLSWLYINTCSEGLANNTSEDLCNTLFKSLERFCYSYGFCCCSFVFLLFFFLVLLKKYLFSSWFVLYHSAKLRHRKKRRYITVSTFHYFTTCLGPFTVKPLMNFSTRTQTLLVSGIFFKFCCLKYIAWFWSSFYWLLSNYHVSKHSKIVLHLKFVIKK